MHSVTLPTVTTASLPAVESLEHRAMLSAITAAPDVGISGLHGLRATFYNDPPRFGGPAVVMDAPVDPDEYFGNTPPDPRVQSEVFSALLEAELVPEFTERYTLWVAITYTDVVGLKLIDAETGDVVIDSFFDTFRRGYDQKMPGPGFDDPIGSADLVSGRRYLLQIRYGKAEGDAGYRLGWQSASTPLAVIPVERLSPPPGPAGPKVAGVYVNGRGFTAPFREFLKTNYYSDAARGYALGEVGGNGSLPWFGVDEISVRFDRGVAVDRDDLGIRGVDGSAYAFSEFRYDTEALIGTWKLARPIDGDRVTLTIDGTGDGVTGAEDGARLDGEWFDSTAGLSPTAFRPGRSFPTGDGSAGGDFRLAFGVLPGDANSDGAVNAVDLAEVKRRLNTRSTDYSWQHPVPYSPFADVTADGRINAADLAAVKSRLNRRLPPPPPPVAPAAPLDDREGAWEVLYL